MNNSTGIPIIDLLITHEEIIGRFYTVCKTKFPSMADFWQDLILEEKAHAEVLRLLVNKLGTGKLVLNERKFNTTGIQTAIDHIGRQIQLLSNGDVTLVQVMSIALDIERAIIERDFFEVFDTDSAIMKQEFIALRKHTLEHVKRIAAKFDQIRQQSGK